MMTPKRLAKSFLNGDTLTVRNDIAKHVDAISLNPGEDSYEVTGSWNLLGSMRVGPASEREARMNDPMAR
jgi:hypothetical protein